MTAENPKLTITLTGRRPVIVTKSEWPVIANADDDSWTGGDYALHQQAQSRGELDEYRIRVRQHEDGRAIVYAILDGASAWTGSKDRREGELLEKGSDLAAAIRRVGSECELPDSVIRACIADLPAEEL